MTKFEEEFKALTSWDWVNVDLIQKILTKFGNWHSDEEFQELFDKYSNLNDNYEKEVIISSKLEDQNIGLKSQLQQQALPVVPECVGEFINVSKGNLSLYGALFSIAGNTNNELNNWVFSEGNQNIFALAFITGKYQVEKPQLFYLVNKLTRLYLYRRDKVSFGEQDYCMDRDDKPLDYCLFTQSEINSMETGSYEQIPVPVEDE